MVATLGAYPDREEVSRVETMLTALEEIEEDVVARAFLYDDPTAYCEGVEAAFEAVRAALSKERIVA